MMIMRMAVTRMRAVMMKMIRKLDMVAVMVIRT